jgi:RNA polymerase sigma-70 factor (ECF subfamily)
MDGDSGAWAQLVREHHRRVYGLCYRFTGSPADAEDLTQDVFLKIYSNLASFDTGRGSLQVWITTMTRNLLVDNFRRTKNQRATGSLDDGWDQAEELKPIDRLTSQNPSPHEMAAKKELEKMVQNALSHVSVELREAVILRDLQDMDYKEIAQVLGIPEGTVKSRISRGRAELARLLERNKRVNARAYKHSELSRLRAVGNPPGGRPGRPVAAGGRIHLQHAHGHVRQLHHPFRRSPAGPGMAGVYLPGTRGARRSAG